MDNQNKTNNIELRSEKVRQLIGEIPPSLVRWGIFIIVLISTVLIVSICLLHYPYSDGETILHHLIGLINF